MDGKQSKRQARARPADAATAERPQGRRGGRLPAASSRTERSTQQRAAQPHPVPPGCRGYQESRGADSCIGTPPAARLFILSSAHSTLKGWRECIKSQINKKRLYAYCGRDSRSRRLLACWAFIAQRFGDGSSIQRLSRMHSGILTGKREEFFQSLMSLKRRLTAVMHRQRKEQLCM